jgi:hypothetical protein
MSLSDGNSGTYGSGYAMPYALMLKEKRSGRYHALKREET